MAARIMHFHTDCKRHEKGIILTLWTFLKLMIYLVNSMNPSIEWNFRWLIDLYDWNEIKTDSLSIA